MHKKTQLLSRIIPIYLRIYCSTAFIQANVQIEFYKLRVYHPFYEFPFISKVLLQIVLYVYNFGELQVK